MLIPIKYNVRYLITRWSSTLMTGFTFALVVAVFVIVMSLSQGLEKAFVSTGDPLNVLAMRPSAQSESQSTLQLDRYQIIRNFRGIARDEANEPLIAPEVLVLVNKPKQPDGKPSNLQIRGVHPQVFKIRSFQTVADPPGTDSGNRIDQRFIKWLGINKKPEGAAKIKIVEGRMFQPGLREVIVSRSVSNRFQNMKVGNKSHLGKGEWTVVGIFDAQGTAYDSEMWTDYQELMREFDRDTYNTAVIRATDAISAKGLIDLVESDQRVKMEGKTEVEYYDQQTTSAKPLKAFGSFLAFMMSIGACFAGMNTLYASVSNRVREIGTLRILGFTPMSILFCFLIESIVLSMVGGMAGCLLALPINGLATGTTNFQTFSEVVFYFTITPQLMAKGIGFAMLMGLIGGLLPAISAARQPIIKTLKQA